MEIRKELTRHEIAQEVAKLIVPSIARTIEQSTRTCLTCDHFKEASETCQLYMKRPPAKVIAFGCPVYINEIPF